MDLINFSVETHQGPFLNVNEDGFEFDFENEIFMIFDGFGGNNIGTYKKI
jgi:serine/threonine protein phosphatase PrpC